MKPCKIIIGSQRLKSNIPKLAVGLGSLRFYRTIVDKHGVFLRSDSFPALIFRRLSGVKNASDSLKNGPFNNYINLQRFINTINQLKVSSHFFKSYVLSACNIRACAKTQKFERFYNPAYKYPETDFYSHKTFTAVKNVIEPCNQSRFIIKTGTEKIIPEHIGEGKGQFIQLFYNPFSYKRETPTSVHKLIFSHLLKGFNFDTSISINAALKDKEKSSFKKTETDQQYENNLPSQIRNRKKQLITIFIQYPLYSRNFLAVMNSAKYSHLKRELKREINSDTSTSINAAIQDMCMLYFKKTETYWKHENNLTKLIRESKKIILKVLNQYPPYSRNTQALVKSLTLDYLNETSNFGFLSLKHSQIVACKNKTDEDSKSARLATQKIDTVFLSKKGNYSYYENNLNKQIGESKKYFISNLNRYPLYVRCTLAVVNSITLSHLHRKLNSVTPMDMKTAIQDMGTLSFKKKEKDSKYEKSKNVSVNQISPAHLHKIFNFVLSSLQHGQIIVNTKKMDETSKNKSLTTHEIDTPYFSKKDTDSHYENNLNKQIERNNKKSIKTLNEYPLYARNILAVVNSVMISHLQGELYFVTLTNIKDATQDMGDIYLKKRDTDLKYENNLTKQIIESKKQFISTLNQYPLYKNILAVVNSMTLGHLQRELSFVTPSNIKAAIQDMCTLSFKKKEKDSKYKKNINRSVNPVAFSYLQKLFDFEFSSLKCGQLIVSKKTMNEASKSTRLTTREIDTASFSKKANNSYYGNNLTKQIGESKKQFITMLNQYPLFARNILINSLVLSHLQRELNFVTSKSIMAAIQEMSTLFFKKTKISLNYENNLIKQIEERKKQFITTLSQYPLFARNILEVTSSVALSYLQKTFDFEFSSSEHGHAPVSIKKLINASMSINTVIQGVNISSTSSINSLTPAYVHNKTIDIPSLETNRIIYSAKKIERHSVRKFVNSQGTKINSEGTYTNSQGTKILLLQKIGIPKNSGDDSSGQVKKEKNQLVTNISNPYLSKKELLALVNDVTFSYLLRTFTFDTINSRIDRIFSSTRKVRISSSIKNKQILSSTINIDKASSLVFATHQRIDFSSSQQIINIPDLSYRQLFNHENNLTGQNEVSAFRNIRLPRRSNNLSRDNVFSTSRVNFEHLYRFIKRSRSPDVDNDSIYESRELILKKSTPQKMEVSSENKGEAQKENISSSKTHHDTDKELSRDKPAREIDMIADRVYKIIEKRISIEKDRRGLF